MTSKLPAGWVHARLSDIVTINPPNPDVFPSDDTVVSFVPMASVEEMSGRLDGTTTRLWRDVKRGYTRFQDGDLVWAKITPSMENGKAALAAGLASGIAAGTTEFHVLRPLVDIEPRYLLHYILQEGVRKRARSRMTGTAGQLRVPTLFLEEERLPVPPAPEQKRIAEAVDLHLSRLDAAVLSLEKAQKKLRAYRTSVLKSAVEGRLVLTEAELARKEDRQYETADVLLAQILQERDSHRGNAQLARMKAAGKTLKDERWKARDRHPSAPDRPPLPALPEGWCWARVGDVAPLQPGYAFASSGFRPVGVRLLKGSNVRDGWIATDQIDHWPEADVERFAPYRLSAGDVVLAMDMPVYSSGTKGTKVALLDARWDGCLLLQRVGCFRRPESIDSHYLYLFVSGGAFRDHIILEQKGSQDGKDLPHVSSRTVDGCPFPLPPQAEQARITEAAERLLSVASQASKAVDNDLRRCQRLRQSILKWAFEGKLVDQEPSDEPASQLLARIRAERAAAVSPKKTRTRTLMTAS
jgi:type I restriction enzyme S subunit